MARSTTRSAVLIAALILQTSAHLLAQQAFPLEVAVRTGKQRYDPGENVSMWMQLCNPNNHQVVVGAGMCCLQSAYRFEVVDENDQVMATWENDELCMAIPCDFTWAPLSCTTEPAGAPTSWNQRMDGWNPRPGEPVPAGWYRVRVSWYHDTYIYQSEPFEVLAVAQRHPVPSLSTAGALCLGIAILLAGVWRARDLLR